MGEAEKKKDDGGKVTAVYKVDMHCEGCAKKFKRVAKNCNGVESVKTDWENNKLTVVGKIDPSKIKDRIVDKTKKKVDLISPQPAAPKKGDNKEKEGGGGGGGDKEKEGGGKDKKEGGGGGEKKSEEKSEKKTEEKKSDDKSKTEESKPEEKKPKQPQVSTVVLKTRVHCEGCASKIKKIINKHADGVQEVNVDLQKDQITVKGTMDMKDLLPYLNTKLKRTVEIVPPPKKDDGGGDKKPKEGGGGGEKKEGGGGGGETKSKSVDQNGNNHKVEVINKMEYMANPSHGYVPMYYDPNPMYASTSHHHQPAETSYGGPSQGYGGGFYPSTYPLPPYQQGYGGPGFPPQQGYYPPHQGYPPHHGYPPQGYPPQGYGMYNDVPPQMFSEENPNACSLM